MNRVDVLIAGSGMMAVSLGDFFLEKNKSVCWVSSSDVQLEKLSRWIVKREKRLEKFFTEPQSFAKAYYRSVQSDDLPSAHVIIESTTEDPAKKESLLSEIHTKLGGQGHYCTNSSSILPEHILPDCIGTHFFYPVALTTCVELIFPEEYEKKTKDDLMFFMQEVGCSILLLDKKSCFLVNRLLLPLQARCIEALQEGFSPKDVEKASGTLISKGQLSMMDTIGIDTLASGVQELTKYPLLEEMDPGRLIQGLSTLINMGKYGKKNRDGFLMGQPLPWKVQEKTETELLNLQTDLQAICINSCKRALKLGYVSKEDIQLLFEKIFFCDLPVHIVNGE